MISIIVLITELLNHAPLRHSDISTHDANLACQVFPVELAIKLRRVILISIEGNFNNASIYGVGCEAEYLDCSEVLSCTENLEQEKLKIMQSLTILIARIISTLTTAVMREL